MNALRDRGVQAALVLAAAALAGLAGLGLAWSGAAATLLPEVQMPFVVSGAIGGVAVAGTALALLATHLERRNSASERVMLEAIIASAAVISDDLPGAIAAGRAEADLVVVGTGRTIHRRGCRVVRNKPVETLTAQHRTDGLRACAICRPDI